MIAPLDYQVPVRVLRSFLATLAPADGGCWRSSRALGRHGYVKVSWKEDGRRINTLGHRVLWVARHGQPPSDRPHLDHLCRNRWCVNPAHVEPVTPRENLRRSPITAISKTHCPAGHAYTEENIYRPPARNERMCRTCMTEGQRRRRAAHAIKPERCPDCDALVGRRRMRKVADKWVCPSCRENYPRRRK